MTRGQGVDAPEACQFVVPGPQTWKPLFGGGSEARRRNGQFFVPPPRLCLVVLRLVAHDRRLERRVQVSVGDEVEDGVAGVGPVVEALPLRL